MRLCAFLLGCCATAGIGGAQTSYPCEASPEIRRALDALPDLSDLRVGREERRRPMRELLAQHPQDLFVLMKDQDQFRHNWHLFQEFDQALARYRSFPQDPVFRYLEARLTAVFRPRTATAMLEQLSRQEPAFPWPHLTLAELTDQPGRHDAATAEQHLRAFLHACPTSIEGYALLRVASDPELIRNGVRKLRALLEARRNLATLPYWRDLWNLEFRAAPNEQQENVRRKVLADVQELQKIPPAPTQAWYGTLRYAAQLTHDQAIETWLSDVIGKQFPQSHLALLLESQRWHREHPRPGPTATPEAMQDYQALESARREEFLRRWPNEPTLLWEAWLSLRLENTLPLNRRLALADAYLAMLRKSPDSGMSFPPVEIELAELYVKWHARLEEVPGLVQAGMRAAAIQEKYRIVTSELSEQLQKQRPFPADWDAITRRRSRLIIADLYLLQRNPDQARAAIELGLADLLQQPSRAELWQREWISRRARLAELDGQAQAALTLYQEYLAGFPKAILAGGSGTPEVREEVARIRALYLANGGTSDRWQEWAAAGPNPVPDQISTPPLAYSFDLPDFEARDTTGKSWRLADLKGKATFIDIWATWCGPCRGEHPELQKLYDQIRTRPNLQVLTFSIDENSYLATSYLKDRRYTFPAIVSKDLADRLFPVVGVPQGWIVDAQGRLSSPTRLFTAERMIAELEKAAAK